MLHICKKTPHIVVYPLQTSRRACPIDHTITIFHKRTHTHTRRNNIGATVITCNRDVPTRLFARYFHYVPSNKFTQKLQVGAPSAKSDKRSNALEEALSSLHRPKNPGPNQHIGCGSGSDPCEGVGSKPLPWRAEGFLQGHQIALSLMP